MKKSTKFIILILLLVSTLKAQTIKLINVRKKNINFKLVNNQTSFETKSENGILKFPGFKTNYSFKLSLSDDRLILLYDLNSLYKIDKIKGNIPLDFRNIIIPKDSKDLCIDIYILYKEGRLGGK